jgi:hypothetical protein
MIKIPYGESDFRRMIEGDYFYQDRTQYIERLEKWDSNYPVFLRPRRFGKSLFVMTLHYYYGLEFKNDFQSLFGSLYIGQYPTGSENTYLVLSFEFSRVDTATQESTYRGFLANVISAARTFIGAYESFYTKEQQNIILTRTSPEDTIKALFDFTKQNQIAHKIYVLIDEYDHFANELLSFDMERFKSNVSQNGFVRKFYESLKTATRDGVIERIFITGVSPVTLDSLTSGFNISDNISLNPIFQGMMGFTHAEVESILHQSAILVDKIPSMMSDLTDWYDGYRFSKVQTEPLFNPDMVLYFLKEYSILSQYPDEMLDSNIMTDYRKIRNIFKIGGEETDNFELLEELVKTGYVDFPLTRVYNLEHSFNQDDFLSLLFYMGMLTLKEAKSSDWRFEVPNYVIKKLYFEYFAAIYLEKTRFSKSLRPITRAIDSMVNDSNPESFFKVVEVVLKENHSNRDELVYGEKHLQTLMIALLFPYKAFKIHSEYESNRLYPDIFLERIPDRNINYEVVLELKYVKKSAESTLDKVIKQAETQLNEYMSADRFNRLDVRGFYVVFLGGQVHTWKEWERA